jgi:hypothetical protein
MLLEISLDIFELFINIGMLVIFSYSSIMEQISDFLIDCGFFLGI